MQGDIPQLYFDVDRDKAQMQGVTLSDIFSTMKAFTGSIYVNDFNMFNRLPGLYSGRGALPRLSGQPEPFLRTRLERNDDSCHIARNDRLHPRTRHDQTLQHVQLGHRHGRGGPRVQFGSGHEGIGGSRPRTPSSVGRGGMERSLLSGETRRRETGFVLALAFLFVFLFLAAQYESWWIPVAVLLSLPVAGIGAYMGIWLCGLENNVYFQIGLVMLVGLVAKNAILIVEFAKERSKRDKIR